MPSVVDADCHSFNVMPNGYIKIWKVGRMSKSNNTQDKTKNVTYSMKWHSPYQLSPSGVVILSVADADCRVFCCYAECHYSECLYAEFRGPCVNLCNFCSIANCFLSFNGTTHFENHKQLLKCQNFILLKDIWWSNL
jgi:hypothetical protein